MDEEEIIKQLHANFSAISVAENLSGVYKINDYIFNLLVKLEKINSPLSGKISTYATKISESSDLGTIHNVAKMAFAELRGRKEDEKYFIPKLRIVISQEYKQATAKYITNKSQIKATEISILTYPKYEKKLHEPIKSGKYKDCWHARITGNLRTVYFVYYEKGILIFVDIITKNDFDNSTRLKPVNWKEKFANF